MRHACRIRRLISSKSHTCTEGVYVYVTGISGKVNAHYPGRSAGLPKGYHRREAVGWIGRSQQKAYYCGKSAGRPEHEVKD